MQEGDGTMARLMSYGLCPKCETEMQFKSDGLEEDSMVCSVCKLEMLTPRHSEMEIVVELE
jgi:hypothetical protein